MKNEKNIEPIQSIDTLEFSNLAGETFPLSKWKGKKILVVNTASECGYTPQYAELDQLDRAFGDRIQVLGFPSNDFGAQEPGDDPQIADFCQTHFGIGFPLSRKTQVIKGPQQHPIYQWLTQSSLNGWLDQEPEWNFSKYLIDKQGRLSHYFGAAVSPMDPQITELL